MEQVAGKGKQAARGMRSAVRHFIERNTSQTWRPLQDVRDYLMDRLTKREKKGELHIQ